MRRADRLFQIIQILQRQKGVITAATIANELEVSERTIYRDIADLMSNKVPIEGERGLGYMMRSGFDLPPLMFNEEEIDAILLGARMVEAKADPDLARAALDVVSKIEAVLPKDRQQLMRSVRSVVPQDKNSLVPVRIDMPVLRDSMRNSEIIEIIYLDLQDNISTREIYPLVTVFIGDVQLLVGWCCLRNGFRNFRIDRIEKMSKTERYFGHDVVNRLLDYLASQHPEN
jgi:predicted DNA-binding transcriptional regulator YafY